MTGLSERSLRRRFLLLTACRWFPTGLVIPVQVLLMQARGLSLATIGSIFALYSLVTAAAELPTGGLADVVGRRVVLVASTALTLVAYILLALARGAAMFTLSIVVFAISRALSSGPLQAWYVDAVHAVDPATDLRPALGREGLVSSCAIGVGTVIGGLLPNVVPGLASHGHDLLITLSVPVWLGAVVLTGTVALTASLLVEPPRTGPAPTLRAVLADVPVAIGSGLAIVRRERAVQRILLSVTATGLAIGATELLAPPYFADLVGNRDRATALYGVLLTVVFFASGLGSSAAPLVARRARGSLLGAAAALGVGMLAYVALGAFDSVIVACGAYVVAYAAFGAADPLRVEQLHHRVTAHERSTMLSVESMAMMAGGALGTAVLPRLAGDDASGVDWYAIAAVLVVGALLVLGVRDRHPAAEASETSVESEASA